MILQEAAGQRQNSGRQRRLRVLEVHSAHDTSDGGFVSALAEIQLFDQALINQAGC